MKARIITLSIIVILVTVGVALVAAAGAQASAITLSKSGSPGPWLGSSSPMGGYDIYCQGTFPLASSNTGGRYFVLNPQDIGRSPHSSYSNYRQDIYMGTQLYWSTNGSNWYAYQATRWQKRASISPGYSASFGQESFDVTPYANVHWFVRTDFRWYVAGTNTLLGTAVDGYNQIQMNYTVNRFSLGTGERGCQFP